LEGEVRIHAVGDALKVRDGDVNIASLPFPVIADLPWWIPI